MLTDIEFNNFEKSFCNYLYTGKLPNDFITSLDLDRYIQNNLSKDQRQYLNNKYDVERQDPNDFGYLWKCMKQVPRALIESVTIGIATWMGSYKYTENDSTSKTVGAAAGFCWLFARLQLNASKIKVEENLFKLHFERHKKSLNFSKFDSIIESSNRKIVMFN